MKPLNLPIPGSISPTNLRFPYKTCEGCGDCFPAETVSPQAVNDYRGKLRYMDLCLTCYPRTVEVNKLREWVENPATKFVPLDRIKVLTKTQGGSK